MHLEVRVMKRSGLILLINNLFKSRRMGIQRHRPVPVLAVSWWLFFFKWHFQELGDEGKGKDFISLGLQNGHVVFRLVNCLCPCWLCPLGSSGKWKMWFVICCSTILDHRVTDQLKSPAASYTVVFQVLWTQILQLYWICESCLCVCGFEFVSAEPETMCVPQLPAGQWSCRDHVQRAHQWRQLAQNHRCQVLLHKPTK